MKNLRKVICVTVLILTLTSSAFAGEIQYPIVSPTPVATNGEMHTDGEIHTDGLMHTDGAPDDATAADAVTEAALTLLQGLLALI